MNKKILAFIFFTLITGNSYAVELSILVTLLGASITEFVISELNNKKENLSLDEFFSTDSVDDDNQISKREKLQIINDYINLVIKPNLVGNPHLNKNGKESVEWSYYSQDLQTYASATLLKYQESPRYPNEESFKKHCEKLAENISLEKKQQCNQNTDPEEQKLKAIQEQFLNNLKKYRASETQKNNSEQDLKKLEQRQKHFQAKLNLTIKTNRKR